MRFLFTTIHQAENDFYARVAQHLETRGHEVAQVCYSRSAAARLGRKLRTYCLPDLMSALGEIDVERESQRILERYDTPTIRDVYKTDTGSAGRSEEWAVEHTVRHFLALERVYDEVDPELVVPEVGSEMMRTVAHLVALQRGITVLFLLYTIFPKPLRLYADTMHAPIAPLEEVRELTPPEREEVEEFIERFTSRGKPIRAYRDARANATGRNDRTGTLLTLAEAARHVRARATTDRDNVYLQPWRGLRTFVLEQVRRRLSARMYEPRDERRPFVYFPLHVTDDYKIKRVIPHCVDQASLIEQVADCLPHGYDIVLKEHPMSVGRNRMALLRRLKRIPNSRLVDPFTSSHDLMKQARAIVVISSTVGLEALMYEQPVLTMGQPFYSGYGVTVDIDSFSEIREAVPAVLEFKPDRERILQFFGAAMRRCYPGSPVTVDSSEENAEVLAQTLDEVAREGLAPRALAPTWR